MARQENGTELDISTFKVISKALTESTGQQNAILNDRKHHRALRVPASQIPRVIHATSTNDSLIIMLKTKVVCSVENLVKEIGKTPSMTTESHLLQ